ncbi:putative NADPH:adrenodoxin oxidoreductase [Planoprotostelium fungivorum]|uniref:NADPH:adrenodoxin oxidoreductase, mitochondrial n=1 Tax=Planoprotostelium fungivorum TaxID=1890364 RepID=A0A2P6NZU0_9EUKA|nr:putative NADPH:adrenodoxin oxidoreductase [Planoprotostelium fungivorum]
MLPNLARHTRCLLHSRVSRPFNTIRPRFISNQRHPYRICVVGSGPAGFYTAESLMKMSSHHPSKGIHKKEEESITIQNVPSFNSNSPLEYTGAVQHEPSAAQTDLDIRVDILEKLPTPYGLVRFGVAPDHPEVKLVQKKFEELINDKCRFFGNITIGKDISIDEIRKNYHAVVYAYGAASDRTLGIPGENAEGVHSARDFVGWLNGHPEYRHLKFDLSGQDAVIIGQGNVALDVARMLLRPISELQGTDITSEATEKLKESNIKRVHILGRRGPAQASFTSKEVREMVNMTGCETMIHPEEAHLNEESQKELSGNRAMKRMVELLTSKSKKWDGKIDENASTRQVFVRFLKSPAEFKMEGGRVKAVLCNETRLEGKEGKQRAVNTGNSEEIPADIVFRSIGYKSLPLEGVPFDNASGTIPNEAGRIHSDGTPVYGSYVSGWLKRGPSGIIGTNKWDAEETAQTIIEDITKGHVEAAASLHSQGELGGLHGFDGFRNKVEERGVQVVEFEDWRLVEEEEDKRGKMAGKPREKITSVEEMLQLINSAKRAKV